MKKFSHAVFMILLYLISHGVLANQVPRGLATDSRIKIVAYDPNQVVRVICHHLVSTNVTLGADEKIISLNNGDSVAWSFEPIKGVPNAFSIKPKLPASNTNLIVYTSKRTYNFQLITQPAFTANSKNVTYLLQFKYPEEEKSQLQEQLNSLQRTVFGTSENVVSLNDNYSFTGSPTLAPIKAVDNGTFTLFVFKKSTPIPAIFSVDNQQNESLLNFRTEGDKVYIQGVHHQYTFRNGEEVTTIYNDSRG